MFETAELGLRALIDLGFAADEAGAELPCQVNDPEMWFAERPRARGALGRLGR